MPILRELFNTKIVAQDGNIADAIKFDIPHVKKAFSPAEPFDAVAFVFGEKAFDPSEPRDEPDPG